MQHERDFTLDPNTHLVTEDAGFVLFVAAMLAAAAFVLVASFAITRTAALPRLIGLLGFPTAMSLAAAWYYLPVCALLAWVAVVSLSLTRRDDVITHPSAAPS